MAHCLWAFCHLIAPISSFSRKKIRTTKTPFAIHLPEKNNPSDFSPKNAGAGANDTKVPALCRQHAGHGLGSAGRASGSTQTAACADGSVVFFLLFALFVFFFSVGKKSKTCFCFLIIFYYFLFGWEQVEKNNPKQWGEDTPPKVLQAFWDRDHEE